MADLVRVLSPQPWRITAAFNGSPSLTASDYTVARVDAATTDILVTYVFAKGQNTVALALSSPLLDGVPYTLACAGSTTTLTIGQRGALVPTAGATTTPADERRWGIDWAWLSSGSLDARRQVPRRSGRECVRHDLAALRLLSPTEIFHRARAGANLRRFTNASSIYKDTVDAALRTAWTRDFRVRAGSVTVESEFDSQTGELVTTGEVILDANGEVLALDSTDVQAR